MSDTTKADAARDAVLDKIVEMSGRVGNPEHVRALAEAYALVTGTLTTVEHTTVETS